MHLQQRRFQPLLSFATHTLRPQIRVPIRYHSIKKSNIITETGIRNVLTGYHSFSKWGASPHSVESRFKMGKRFPSFVPPTLTVPEEVLEKIVDECNSKLANYGEVFGNETERGEFISSILHRINFAYSNKVLMRREYSIKSNIAGGPVEYVFIRAESSDPAFVTAVTEAKGKDMRGGRAQCLMQLEVAHHINQQHAGVSLNFVYGMVTDGMHWHFLRFGGPSDIAWSKEYSCFPATDAVSVEHIRTTASVINGILHDQAEQL